jgi:hypothetical protein
MITRLLLVVGMLSALCTWFLLGADKPVAGADTVFQVQLIWGTNADSPPDKEFKDVDPKIQAQFKGIFKWKKYYEVSRKSLSVPKDGAPKLKLSDKCEIQVQDLGGGRAEIRLFGNGKLVVKQFQKIVPGNPVVLAGDCDDASAWFVVLTPAK